MFQHVIFCCLLLLPRSPALALDEEAERNIRFIEEYRSYVINYSLGEDIVQSYIEGQTGDQASRWRAFEEMLTGLVTASDMAGP